MFGDGEICKANAISEADLAEVMADCITVKVSFATERCSIHVRLKDFRGETFLFSRPPPDIKSIEAEVMSETPGDSEDPPSSALSTMPLVLEPF